MRAHPFWEIIRHYKWESVLVRSFLLILALVILPFSCLLAFSGATHFQKTQENMVQRCEFETSQVTSQMSALLAAAVQHYSILISDSALQIYLLADAQNQLAVTRNMDALQQALYAVLYAIPSVDSIFLYNTRSDYILGLRGASNFRSQHSETEWLARYERQGNYIARQTINGLPSVTLCFGIKLLSAADDGVLALNIPCKTLERTLILPGAIADGVRIAVDGESVFELNWDEAQDLTPGWYDDCFVSRTALENNCVVSLRFSSRAFSEQFSQVTNLTLASIGFALLSAIVIARYMSVRFYRSIYRIMNILRGNEDDPARPNDEMRYIAHHIFTMRSQYAEMETALAANLRKLQVLQIQALQEQINPHFIFNALNLISLNEMAAHHRQTENARIVKLLAHIMRSALDTEKYLVPLSEELHILREYIELQNIKYGGVLEFSEQVAPEAANAGCIKFMLQPIAENAISHGLMRGAHCGGKIALTALRNAEILEIRVEDDGAGMEPAALEALKRQLGGADIPIRQHIGLLNVHRRIQLVYGEAYGISPENTETGFRVTYRLPAQNLSEE